MPTYEYICRSCGHLFEIVQSMRDDSLTECPECGGELRKVFAPPAIAFKGSGFYATDQRKKAEAPGDKGDKGEKAGNKDGKPEKDGKKPDAASGTGGDDRGSKREVPAATAKKEASSSSSSSSDSSGASSDSSSSEAGGS